MERTRHPLVIAMHGSVAALDAQSPPRASVFEGAGVVRAAYCCSSVPGAGIFCGKPRVRRLSLPCLSARPPSRTESQIRSNDLALREKPLAVVFDKLILVAAVGVMIKRRPCGGAGGGVSVEADHRIADDMPRAGV